MTNERLQEGSEALVEMLTDKALAETRAAAHRRQCDEPRYADFDGEHCIYCEVPIPLERLAMGCVRCVKCQEREDWVQLNRACRVSR